MDDERTKEQREAMVQNQIVERGVKDPRVRQVLRRVPRHLFVPENARADAYADSALPIGYNQTISQPYCVAVMTEQLRLNGSERVLEIGTGSGYQAAVLSRLALDVYTIEIIPELAERARRTLASLGYANVSVRTGDGWKGWPEAAPFDAVIVTAGAEEIPGALVQQLKHGGRLVMPLGPMDRQELVVLTKTAKGLEKKTLFPVRFVPFIKTTGDAP